MPDRRLPGASTVAFAVSVLLRAAPASAEPTTAELLSEQRAVFEAGRRNYEEQKGVIANVDTSAADAEPASALIPLPVVFYGPETYLGLGGVGLYVFHSGAPKATRTSTLRASAIVTTKKQGLLEFAPDLWLARDTLHVDGVVYLAHFPDAFFGIGNDTPATAREGFTERSVGAQVGMQLRLAPHVYVGTRARVDYRSIDDREPGRILATNRVVGSAGGLTLGAGPALTYDSRDNVNATVRGTYVDLSLFPHPELFANGFRFWSTRLDARQFIPLDVLGLAKGKVILALQAVGELVSGEVPYYFLPRIGGGNSLRGIFYGRYRDNVMLEAQAEVRFPLFWRFGGVAFAGAGEVARSVKRLDAQGLHPAGGGGLRFALVRAERLNVRLDLAYAAEGLNYYLDLNEAF